MRNNQVIITIVELWDKAKEFHILDDYLTRWDDLAEVHVKSYLGLAIEFFDKTHKGKDIVIDTTLVTPEIQAKLSNVPILLN